MFSGRIYTPSVIRAQGRGRGPGGGTLGGDSDAGGRDGGSSVQGGI